MASRPGFELKRRNRRTGAHLPAIARFQSRSLPSAAIPIPRSRKTRTSFSTSNVEQEACPLNLAPTRARRPCWRSAMRSQCFCWKPRFKKEDFAEVSSRWKNLGAVAHARAASDATARINGGLRNRDRARHAQAMTSVRAGGSSSGRRDRTTTGIIHTRRIRALFSSDPKVGERLVADMMTLNRSLSIKTACSRGLKLLGPPDRRSVVVMTIKCRLSRRLAGPHPLEVALSACRVRSPFPSPQHYYGRC